MQQLESLCPTRTTALDLDFPIYITVSSVIKGSQQVFIVFDVNISVCCCVLSSTCIRRSAKVDLMEKLPPIMSRHWRGRDGEVRITSQCLRLWWPHGIIWQLWTGWTLQTVPTYISLNKRGSRWNSSWILAEFLIVWRWPLQAGSDPVLIGLRQIEVRSFMERTGSAGLFHWRTAAANRKGDSQSCASPGM